MSGYGRNETAATEYADKAQDYGYQTLGKTASTAKVDRDREVHYFLGSINGRISNLEKMVEVLTDRLRQISGERPERPVDGEAMRAAVSELGGTLANVDMRLAEMFSRLSHQVSALEI